MQAMFELLPPEEIAYDVITGVSVGAVNTAVMSLFKKYEEEIASSYLGKENH
jgi:predicted acylesterase/phospholipase RssA